MAESTVDYSILYDCESHVDSSFRRLRLSHNQLKKRISGAHESYLRKIIDMNRRQTAAEQSTAYNKRLKRKKIPGKKTEKKESDSEDEKQVQRDTVEEDLEEVEVSELGTPRIEKKVSLSQMFRSPYAKSPRGSPRQRGKSVPKKRLVRGMTKDVMEVDADISKEYTEGRISKAQYHKRLLLRNRMIHFQCLEDLDEEGLADKDLDTIQQERLAIQKELKKTIARFPKEYASLHSKPKVPTSHSNSAFRPHRDPLPKPTNPVPRIQSTPQVQSKSQEKLQYVRQQFFVTTRPSSELGTLGGGTSLRSANYKHGGRLSAQNLVNYLLNKPLPKRKRPVHPPSPPPDVRIAVKRARERLMEDRTRSVSRLESSHMRDLQQSVLTHTGDVSLDIPSYLNTPLVSVQGSERSSKLHIKKTSLRDLLSLS